MIRVRPAELADAPAISRIHTAAWRQAYVGIVPQAHLDALDSEARIPKWERDIQAPIPHVRVAEVAGVVRGWITFGPGRDADAEPHWAEIWALYVHPDTFGQGMGRALCEQASTELVRMGFTCLTLWVLTLNLPARQFYERMGFGEDTVAPQTFEILGATIEEVRYRREVVLSIP